MDKPKAHTPRQGLTTTVEQGTETDPPTRKPSTACPQPRSAQDAELTHGQPYVGLGTPTHPQAGLPVDGRSP